MDEKTNWYSLVTENIESNDRYYASSGLVNSEVEYYDGTTWRKTSSIDKNEMLISLYQLKDFDLEDY